MSLTTDPAHPDLTRGVDFEVTPQAKVYLVLSDEEKAKGFVRPVRRTYVHVGRKVCSNRYRHLTEEEKEQYKDQGYVAFVPNDDEDSSLIGTYITQHELNTFKNHRVGGCGVATTMALGIAETYARDPKFYGATYCVGCCKHLPVGEFLWDNTNETVGS